MKKIYLDHAAATPVDPEVLGAMEPYFSERFGNPGSLHAFGQEAIAAVDRARETIARALGAEFRQIIFTASATEANNLALRGAANGASRASRAGVAGGGWAPRLAVSAVEHESVLETAKDLERGGAKVTVIPVDGRGVVDGKKLEEALSPDTAVVSVMYAQNEIGTVEPVAEIARAVREFREGDGARKKTARAAAARAGGGFPLFHTDAAQAFQFFDCDAKKLGADLMTISSQKIYGPKGAAALFARDSAALAPATTGGGQEFGMRSGTENVPAIVGFAKAVEMAVAARERESRRLAGLCRRLWEGIRAACPDAEVNGIAPGACGAASGSMADGVARRMPNILNVFFPGRAADELLTKFDLKGLAASSGSACRARAAAPSYVVAALGRGGGAASPAVTGAAAARARQSIRFSLGRPTAAAEIEGAIAIIKAAL